MSWFISYLVRRGSTAYEQVSSTMYEMSSDSSKTHRGRSAREQEQAEAKVRERMDRAREKTEAAEAKVRERSEQAQERIARALDRVADAEDRAGEKVARAIARAERAGGAAETLRDGDPFEPLIWFRQEPASRRPAHTRSDIARAALEIADSEGIDAVSMRKVAQRLGAGT